MAEHAPKHGPLEQIKKMFPQGGPLPHDQWRQQLSELGRPRATLVESVPKPRTMMEMYGVDTRRLYQDLMERPDHYTPEHRHLIECLHFNRPMPIEPTREQLDDLFYRWVERTEQVKRRQEILRKATDISDHAEFEGDQKAPTHEDQNFDDLIKII